MPYMSVEDDFADHPKVVALWGGPCAADAIALWVLAGSWSSRQLTDGFIPDARVKLFPTKAKAAAELVRVGLWTRVEGGYQFHEWSERNPSAAGVKKRRAKQAERTRRHRQKRMGNEPDEAPSNGARNALQTPLRNALPDPLQTDAVTDHVTRYGDVTCNDVTGPPARVHPRVIPGPGPYPSSTLPVRSAVQGGRTRGPDDDRAGGGDVIPIRPSGPLRHRPPVDLAEAHTWLRIRLDDAWMALRACPLGGEHQAVQDAATWIWRVVEGDPERFANLAARLVERWISDPWIARNRVVNPAANFRHRLQALYDAEEAPPAPVDLEAELAAEREAIRVRRMHAREIADHQAREAALAACDEAEAHLRQRYREIEGRAS